MTEKFAALVYVSDEAIVDYKLGTVEDQAAAAERIDERRRETEARWRALPIWTRLRIRLRARVRW